jgi:hypothetical protein
VEGIMSQSFRRAAVAIAILFCSIARPEIASADGTATVAAMREKYVSYDVEGYQFADGRVSVVIIRKDGSVAFESHYPEPAPDGDHLSWSYHGVNELSRSAAIPKNTSVTLEKMSGAARDIVRMADRGGVPPEEGSAATMSRLPHPATPFNNIGCDSPFEDLSCTTSGNCCDSHDTCYLMFHCDITSWLGLQSDYCSACNATAVLCITFGAGSTGQPSWCCAAGTCGQPLGPSGDAGGGYGGPDNQDFGSGASGGGGGDVWYTTPYGSVSVGPAKCKFPDGTVIPCS